MVLWSGIMQGMHPAEAKLGTSAKPSCHSLSASPSNSTDTACSASCQDLAEGMPLAATAHEPPCSLPHQARSACCRTGGEEGERKLHLRFLETPREVLDDGQGRASGLRLEENELIAGPAGQRAQGTGRMNYLAVSPHRVRTAQVACVGWSGLCWRPRAAVRGKCGVDPVVQLSALQHPACRTPAHVLGGVCADVNWVLMCPAWLAGLFGTAIRGCAQADLVLASIGYRCLPMPGAPFDEATSTIANRCFTSYAARTHWDLWTQHGMLFCDQLQCHIDQRWGIAAASARRPTRAVHWRTAGLAPGACLNVGLSSEGHEVPAPASCHLPSLI